MSAHRGLTGRLKIKYLALDLILSRIQEIPLPCFQIHTCSEGERMTFIILSAILDLAAHKFHTLPTKPVISLFLIVEYYFIVIVSLFSPK